MSLRNTIDCVIALLLFNNFFVLFRLAGKEKRVGGYDLMWNNGPVYREHVNLETFGSSCLTANTHLGNLTMLLMQTFARKHPHFSGLLLNVQKHTCIRPQCLIMWKIHLSFYCVTNCCKYTPVLCYRMCE